jgi:2-haloacid dehalogenase
MPRYDAALFDLLSALLDSWSLFNTVAGSEESGLQWRKAYLRHAYATGAYVDYAQIACDSAREVGLPETLADELVRRWDELSPWPEAREVLAQLGTRVRLGIVTNCSEVLGRRAAGLVGVPFAAVTTAERAGFYKPDPRTYRAALEALGTPPSRTLFVAGSPGDVAGASGAGMDVFWHNRRGLALPASSPRPLREERSLRPLLEVIR